MQEQDQGPVIVSSSVAASVPLPVLRGNVLQKWDLRFTLVILFSILAHGGFLYYLNQVEVPKEEVIALEKIPERIVKYIVDKPLPKQEKKVVSSEKTKADKEAKGDEEEGKNDTPEQKKAKAKAKRVKQARKAVAARSRRVQKKLRSAGVLGILAGVGSTARGPAVVDVLGRQGRMAGGGSLDLSGVHGLRKGSNALNQELVRSRDSRGSGQREDISNLIAGLGAAGSSNLSKRGTINYKRPEIVGEASSSAKRADAAISRVVKRKLPNIKIAYEKELKKNPKLSGKITIRFVINEDGSVSDVEVVESTMNSPALERAIIRRIKRWKFAALAAGSGSTAVTYPFVFQPS